jgi:hypothetical protein
LKGSHRMIILMIYCDCSAMLNSSILCNFRKYFMVTSAQCSEFLNHITLY